MVRFSTKKVAVEPTETNFMCEKAFKLKEKEELELRSWKKSDLTFQTILSNISRLLVNIKMAVIIHFLQKNLKCGLIIVHRSNFFAKVNYL